MGCDLRHALRWCAIGVLLLLGSTPPNRAIAAPIKTAHNATFRNPLKVDGADPCLTSYKGWYYLSTSTSNDIRIRRAQRLGELSAAPDHVVWQDDTPLRSHEIWAAEFHLLESGHGLRWYLYYTAGEKDHHQLYVAESQGKDPLGPYHFKAQLQTDVGAIHYAIDGTVLQRPDKSLYCLWCGHSETTGLGLFIARMANPWTLTRSHNTLPADGFGCGYVREAPELLQRNGKVFLMYSMCGATSPDYRLGMLSADNKSDLLSATSWRQHPQLMFARVDQYGVYGPGHCFFFQSPDGTEDWIAYHAKSGTIDTYTDRSARAQRFTWNDDGTPNFGVPLPLDADIPAPSGEPR